MTSQFDIYTTYLPTFITILYETIWQLGTREEERHKDQHLVRIFLILHSSYLTIKKLTMTLFHLETNLKFETNNNAVMLLFQLNVAESQES